VCCGVFLKCVRFLSVSACVCVCFEEVDGVVHRLEA